MDSATIAAAKAGADLAQNAADLIVKYGFLGVGVVLACMIAPAAYGVWKSKPVALATFSCGLAFVVTWGVLDIVQKNFPWLISSHRSLLNGTVLNVPNGYQVQVASDLRLVGAAYLKREFDQQNPAIYNFPFLLLSSAAPKCLSVGISNNNPNSEAGSSGFNVGPISPDDLKSEIVLVAQAERQDKGFVLKVWRESGGVQIGARSTIKPLADNAEGCSYGRTADVGGWLVSTAHAQTSAPDLPARLKSDDLFTRRNARIELAKQGPDAADKTRALLDTTDYRLQLGALVALSIMTADELKKLPPDIAGKVRELTSSSDPTIRETAARIERAAGQ